MAAQQHVAPAVRQRASQASPLGGKLQTIAEHDGASTTASGCSSPRSVQDRDLAAQPAVQFPVQLRVRRTFLEFPLQDSPSQLRRTRSAPSLLCEGSACLLQPPRWADTDGDLAAAPPPVLPSRGSEEHYSGGCKPCAFFWKDRGCSLEADCPFCHLCDSSEKQRRQKEKKAAFRKRSMAKRAR